MVAEIKTFREISLEQPFGQLVSFAMLFGELRQLMGIMGVRGDDVIHVVLQPDFSGLHSDLLIHLFGSFVGHAVFLGQHRVNILAGLLLGIGRELEAAEANLDLVAMRELLQGCFEFAFADIAEWASKV